jgi:hypothetical protein
MRFVFLGGRTASGEGEYEEIYGDRQLYVLDVRTNKFRILMLPKLTCESPIRGVMR